MAVPQRCLHGLLAASNSDANGLDLPLRPDGQAAQVCLRNSGASLGIDLQGVNRTPHRINGAKLGVALSAMQLSDSVGPAQKLPTLSTPQQ